MSGLINYQKLATCFGILKPEVVAELLSSIEKEKRPLVFLPNLKVKSSRRLGRSEVRTSSEFLIWNPFKFKYELSNHLLRDDKWLGEGGWLINSTDNIELNGEIYKLQPSPSSRSPFLWNGYLVCSGDSGKIYKRDKKEWKIVFTQYDTNFYPFTFSDGRELLIIHHVPELITYQRKEKIAFTTTLEKISLNWSIINSPFHFFSNNYFTKGSNLLKQREIEDFNDYRTTEIYELKENILELVKIQELETEPRNLIPLSVGKEKLEFFLKIDNSSFFLYWKPHYSSIFSEIGEVYNYSKDTFGYEVSVLSSEWSQSDKKKFVSKLPIICLPADLLIEILDFLKY
jgi:hypothetical protein